MDEFNRIQTEVLSVIAQQLLLIKVNLHKLADWSGNKDKQGEGAAEGDP